MPEDKVTEALRFAAEPLSLSEPLREDGDAELGDIVEDRSAESPFEVAATALLPDEIEKLLAPLDERERQILALRFGLDRGEPRTLEEVGRVLQPHPGADPPDRGPGDVEAAAPERRHRRPRPPRRLTRFIARFARSPPLPLPVAVVRSRAYDVRPRSAAERCPMKKLLILLILVAIGVAVAPEGPREPRRREEQHAPEHRGDERRGEDSQLRVARERGRSGRT